MKYPIMYSLIGVGIIVIVVLVVWLIARKHSNNNLPRAQDKIK